MILISLLQKYDALTLPEACPAYLDAAPVRAADGSAVSQPYTIFTDVDTVPEYDDEYHPLERTTLKLKVFAPTLARAAALAEAVKYNGSRPALAGGFDFAATLPNLPSAAYRHLHLKRLREQPQQLPARGQSAALMFAVVLSYEHLAQRLV